MLHQIKPLHLPGLLTLVTTLSVGCTPGGVDTPSPEDNPQEVITTVELTFTPSGGGDSVVARFADPENDGDPIVDPIALADGGNYTLAIRFLNELASPTEDVTEEVLDEADEHQVFIYGDVVDGPASTVPNAILTQAYADEDDNGFPIGLNHDLVANAAGTGSLSVLLRHLPPENDTPVKTADLAEDFAANGEAGIPGDTDVNVTFDVEVQ